MKCACGYIHERGIDNYGVFNPNRKGDEPFQKLCLEIDGKEVSAKAKCLNDTFFLYRCPKCGTIRTETNDWY
ncbi:MAG: hypothetical protein M0P12_03115 [Paludibacteraceae bacterium]|nr:hypothetical protein [Paludibacteraceae bacterium]MCK9615920.1 hypothetical protein [Candidatus Omnitrophota bacterium]